MRRHRLRASILHLRLLVSRRSTDSKLARASAPAPSYAPCIQPLRGTQLHAPPECMMLYCSTNTQRAAMQVRQQTATYRATNSLGRPPLYNNQPEADTSSWPAAAALPADATLHLDPANPCGFNGTAIVVWCLHDPPLHTKTRCGNLVGTRW
jgi:hypothetical protein